MRSTNKRNLETRRTIERAAMAATYEQGVAGRPEPAPASPIATLLVVSDAVEEGRESDVVALLAQIPPVKLGRTLYRVVAGGRHGFELIGPQGGHSSLVQNEKRPTLWAHVRSISSRGAKYDWYRSADGLAFEAL